MSVTTWTQDQDALLKELLGLGNSHSQCVKAINTKFGTDYSRDAACGRAHRMGLSVPFKPRPLDAIPPKPRNRTAGRPPKAPSIVPGSPARFKLSPFDLIELRCVPVEPMNIGLMELDERTCRYPYGDDHFTYCGHPTIIGRPYCGPHTGLTTGYG